LERANDLLGYDYPLSGEVIHGQKRGRTIGFPTANIQLDEPHKLVPPNGVYAATVTIGLVTYPVVMNIGVRPTVNGTEKSIEAHIIGLDQDLYNQRIQVNLRFYLRKERKFANLELLKEQIQNDVNYAVQILS
jgi:riboflavin kinase/FMN adenylyltransferase